MIILSHVTYPSLSYILASKLFNLQYSFFYFSTLIISSVLPDFDFLFHKLVKKGKFDSIYADRWQLRIEHIKNAVYFVEPEPLSTGEDSTQLPSV